MSREPRTKTGRWLISGDGLDPDALSYHDVNGDPIDLREMVCRVEDEAQSMRWPRALLADSPSVEPLVEHEWEDASDDETAWYCPKCGVTEHPGEGVHEDDVLAWREACEAFEREMWPDGPASGSGSGVWAAHKDRLFRAAR